MALLKKQENGRYKIPIISNMGISVPGIIQALLGKKKQTAPIDWTPSYGIPNLTRNVGQIPFKQTQTAPVVDTSSYNLPPSSGSGGGNRSYSSNTSTTRNQNPTTNFTSALMKILKDAQVQQMAGQAGLMKQSQDITGTGLDMANQINTGDIEQLNPESIVGLRRGAIGAVQPGELSVENQIKLSNAGFSNINDLVDRTLGSYEKEQDRLLSEQQHRETIAAAASNPYANYSARQAEQLSNAQKRIAAEIGKARSGTRDNDGFLTPETYRNFKAAWVADGLDGGDFDSVFGGYVNPKNAQQYGVGFQTKVSSNIEEDWQSELLNAI